MKRNQAIPIALIASALLHLPTEVQAQDDSTLFANAVPPNVMLMVDNSGSMQHIVWHPEFDPTADPGCQVVFYFGDGSSLTIENDTSYAFAGDITYTSCDGNERTLYEDDELGYTVILGRYLNWWWSDQSEAYHKGVGNTDEDNLESLTNGERSDCLVDEGLSSTYTRYRRTRITAAKEVLREVVCQVNAAGAVRFGLAQFQAGSSDPNGDPRGGFVKVPIADYDTAQGTAIENFIVNLTAEAWTPLGETLYNVYRYFQSRDNPAFGRDGDDDGSPDANFEAYNLDTDGNVVDPADAPASPQELDCQKNFVVIITDGEPTMDDFDLMNPTLFDELIGDYNPDNTNPEAGDETPGTGDDGTIETAWYLDDIAKFMHDNDFERDFDGDQTLDIYTIGFTTNPVADAILSKTAAVGGGFFRQSNNAEDLTVAIVTQILDIIQKSQSFTSATVPSSRTTEGESFYSTYFRPLANSPFWDGHLKNFEFTANGDVLTKTGQCAIGDSALTPPNCPTSGALLNAEEAEWDASQEMPLPDDRNVYTGDRETNFGARPRIWKGTGGGKIDRNDLRLPDVPDAELTADPYNLPDPNNNGDLDTLAEQIVSSLAGCRFGTLLGGDCDARESDGVDATLGDIFHSNPLVIGSPNSRINAPYYGAFAAAKRTRDKVLYAGSNAGWLHGFHAGDWATTDDMGDPLVPPRHDRGTGTELFGFMPTEVRESIWKLELSQPFGTVRSLTTVDGSPVAADVWMYRDIDVSGNLGIVLDPPTSTVREIDQWRTVLVAGLRDGGGSYYALDITNPGAANYPGYLWDFPCDINEVTGDCLDGGDSAVNPGSHSWRNWIGNTWSEPVITRVRVAVDGDNTPGGHERWVAVVGGGYDPCGDPHHIAYDDTASGELCDSSDPTKESRGRGIFMIDITTGEVLAAKVYTDAVTPAGSPTATVGQHGYPEFDYAFASAPAVFDVNFDGFADVIYIGDLGGQMWKWVVGSVGDDPINNTTANASVGQPDWPFMKFFEGAPSTGVTPTHYQSFFAAPTAAYSHGKLTLAWGAGERANINGGVADSGNLVNNNHFYVVEDSDPFMVTGTPTTLTEADLVDVTGVIEDETDIDSAASCSDFNGKGYYITGRDREKFFTNAVIFLGEVITGSFLPADIGANDCQASGTSYLYRFKLRCAIGDYPSTTDPADKRRKPIGQGIPTRPRVSVGDLNQGGSTSGCANKVVIITSDGDIENDCPGNLDSLGIGIRTWRHR